MKRESLLLLSLLLPSISAFAVDKGQLDPVLMHTVGGLNVVQSSAIDTGYIDCGCEINEDLSSKPPKGTVSAVFGDGIASTGDTLKKRAVSIRIGKEIGKDGKVRVDFVHLNEGHPENNHRDGFALQGTYVLHITENLNAEGSLGYYTSFNTTTIDGKELDDKHGGPLVTAAIVYYLDRLYPGLHLRAEYNHVAMKTMNTDSIMIGAGRTFGGPKKPSRSDDSDKDFSVELAVNNFKTNHGGTDSSKGFQIDGKKQITDNTSVVVVLMNEGKDSRVDRKGIAAQLWHEVKLNDKWSAGAGIGPYIAKNKLDKNSGIVNGLISFGASREIGKNWKGFIRFSRIADLKGTPITRGKDKVANDRDIVGFGIERKLK